MSGFVALYFLVMGLYMAAVTYLTGPHPNIFLDREAFNIDMIRTFAWAVLPLSILAMIRWTLLGHRYWAVFGIFVSLLSVVYLLRHAVA